MRPFVVRWLFTSLAVLVAVRTIPGISSAGILPLLGAALFLGILNALVRPVLLLLSLPFIIVTLGLFILVLNALLLWLVGGGIVPGFRVDGFWSAFFGALVISAVNWLLSLFFRGSDGKVHLITAHLSQQKSVEGRVIR